MKHLLLTTIAAVLVVGCGCGNPEADRALLKAAHDGNIEAVKEHLAAGTDVNAKNKDGTTPLHSAAMGGHKEIAELLIANGADVNAIIVSGRNKGNTPLYYAAVNGHKEVAELLIANDADVNAKGADGETPLDVAIRAERTETADLLRKHGGKHGTIHYAVGDGDIEVVKEFLAAGTDVNSKNKHGGITPLHLAAIYDHKEIAKLLIAKGAEVNAKDEDGRTPLDNAIFYKRTETADLLRKHGGKTGEELKAEGK